MTCTLASIAELFRFEFDFFGTAAPLASARSSVPCLSVVYVIRAAQATHPQTRRCAASLPSDTRSLFLRVSRAPMALRGLHVPSHLRSHVGSAVSDVRRFSATVVARTPRVSAAAAGAHRGLHNRAGAASRSLVVHVVANELNKWCVSHVVSASAVASGRRHERSCTAKVERRSFNCLTVPCRASPDGGEESPFGDLDDDFTKDTMRLTTKLLTARSVQKLLSILEDTSVVTAMWFNNFVAQHPPLQEGENFILGLLRAQAVYAAEVLSSGGDSETADRVSPSELASRIMAQRSAMAIAISTADGPLARYVAVSNLSALRNHMQKSCYISGN